MVALLVAACGSNETVGTQQWATTFEEHPVDSEWHANGRFYTAGSDRLLVLDADGAVVWQKDLSRVEAMRTTDDGSLIATGQADQRTWLKNLSASGDELWSVEFAGVCTNHILTLTSDGGFVLAGYTTDMVDFGGGTLSERFIASFDAMGVHRWSAGLGNDEVVALEPLSNGHVALSVGLGQAPRIAVLSELGVEQWSEPLVGPARLTVDESDQLFVAAWWGELSLWTAEGDPLWRVADSKLVGVGPPQGRGFSLDAEGNSVAGWGTNDTSYRLVSYDNTGTERWRTELLADWVGVVAPDGNGGWFAQVGLGSFLGNVFENQARLYHLDSAGEIQTVEKFRGGTPEYLATRDGVLLVKGHAGESMTYGPGTLEGGTGTGTQFLLKRIY